MSLISLGKFEIFGRTKLHQNHLSESSRTCYKPCMRTLILTLILAASPALATSTVPPSQAQMCRQMIMHYQLNPVPGTRQEFNQRELELAEVAGVMSAQDQQTLRTFMRLPAPGRYKLIKFACK